MNEQEFDKAVGTSVRQSVNAGIEPVIIIGIMVANMLDVYHHMKKAQAEATKANGKPSILTSDQINKLRQKGGN